MKDRFKFRVWDGEKMHYPDFDFKTGGFVLVICNNTGYGIQDVDGNWILQDGELMQCTGLKDRNGELIWEGDVIRSIYWHPLVESCEVYYHQDSARWLAKHSTGNRSLDSIECSQVYEVIGNIYENPDLLT